MRLPDNEEARKDLALKIVLLLFAIALNALEFFIPRLPFFPWLKPGLANIITMIWIIRYGTADALVYSIVRSWIAGCYFGFSLVSLSLALSGGLISTLIMGALWATLGNRRVMGCIGIGVAGALFHNVGQLLAVYVLLTTNDRVFYQFPVMALASVLFGGCVGALVPRVMRVFDRTFDGQYPPQVALPTRDRSPKRGETAITIVLFTLSFVLVFVHSTVALSIIATGTALALLIMFKGAFSLVFRPLFRFWALFLFIAFVYCILPYGTRLEKLSFLTHESVTATVQQWLRLYTWLALSFILTRYRFHIVLFTLLTRILRQWEVTLSAGLFAFEFFPLVAQIGKKRGKAFFRNLIKHPIHSAQEGIGGLYEEIVEKVQQGEDITIFKK